MSTINNVSFKFKDLGVDNFEDARKIINSAHILHKMRYERLCGINGIAPHILSQMREQDSEQKAQTEPQSNHYQPIRHARAKPHRVVQKTKLHQLTDEVFQKFYPVGTTVRYYQKDYQIQGFLDNQMVKISRDKTEEIVPLRRLRPNVKKGDRVLLLDPEDSYKRHAVALINSTERGIVKATWEKFGQASVTTSFNHFDALARIIPIHGHSLDDLEVEVISCKMDDDSTTYGKVYHLLKA